MNTTRRQRAELILLGVLVFSLAFIVILLITYSPDILSKETGRSPIKWSVLISVFLLGAAFVAYLGNAVVSVWQLFTQFAQHFYDLSWDDAEELVTHFLFGLREEPPTKPILRVLEGQADPDGPVMMHKVGGPGHLSVAYDSAVVTSKLGKLYRVLGPGFRQLEPFERVWDVIDLRLQRRSLHVEFMTLDGIPAYCDAEILFRVAGPATGASSSTQGQPPLPQSYPFDEEAVLRLATSKYVKSREGSGRIQDWRIGLVNGALDGIMRDLLERYKLDEFIYPWDLMPGATSPATPPPPSVKITDLQAIVEKAIKDVGKARGVTVESVSLSPVLPAEEAIPRQWLELWQAKLQHSVAINVTIGEEATRADLLEQANVAAQVELISGITREVQGLLDTATEVPKQLVVASFMEVLRAMSDREPAVRQLMYQQAESLMRIVNAVRGPNPLFNVPLSSPIVGPPVPPSPSSPS